MESWKLFLNVFIVSSGLSILLTDMFSLNIEIDSGFYTVKFDSLLLKDAVVEADCVIPPLREDDPLSSDSDLDDTGEGEDVAYAKGVCGDVLPFPCQTKFELAFEILSYWPCVPFYMLIKILTC